MLSFIRPSLNVGTSVHKLIESFIIQEQAVAHHALVVFAQYPVHLPRRYQLQSAGHGFMVIDPGSRSVLFTKEHGFMASYRDRECLI